MHLIQGHSDPRVFFSPRGEPLMIVGTNGIHNCLGQYLIDLRALVPDLAAKMHITDIPIRFPNLTELTRPNLQEIEKNWFMMFDSLDSNREYLHYDFLHRSLAALKPPADIATYKSIANPSPELVRGLLQNFKKSDYSANDIHQASNSLLVTLCDFPCIPTIHNTVLVELMHIKYSDYYRLYYRRFAIIMNATAPFDVLGRTENLMYAGTDSDTMIYTVSMAWDKGNFPRHEPWDESRHGGKEIWLELDIQQQLERERNKAPTVSPIDDTFDQEEADSMALHKRATSSSQNPFISDGYHGWLDDVLMINIGINDNAAGTIHTTAKDLLECITLA
ncbi:uncharacterized protein V1516DRAFT_681111 [Lipomyces oligophaga]|uniref:uncharacterized protein n=1 Tax=Lipomyces oligophaga TaxID=45792 RepID=UPI0034CD677E